MEEMLNELLFLTKVFLNPLLFHNKVKIIAFLAIIFLFMPKSNIKKNLPNWYKIRHNFELLINKYKYLIRYEKNIEENSPIWMMWYQGIETAPPIVLSCMQSIIQNREKHPVIIISKYNLEKYIKLPSYILDKLKKNVFSITHLSDIIRMALLSKYGGYWIDSTYLVSTPFTKVNSSFFTLKLNYCWTNALPFITCQWSGNFIATSKNSFIATFGYNAFLYYWKKYNSLIYYFLIDYIIYTAYNTEKRFKKKVEELPFTTCDIFSLKKSLNITYNRTDFRCPFNKLSKNKKCNKTIGINNTNYGYIIKNYEFHFENENKTFFAK